ncbi:hypothetical protein FPJ27_14765 [Burkholderia sp. MS455]|uniref:hypothetical protein n=1 Tax=Burkholderia sp. MS455 TaxID=2811788 RepID=UPI0019571A9E|nr:hypothetical protein [Burkholderia sp. MS455]QRR07559.1 hypothetical protein FPJ27_14765 [Burkholderia sp. MS455]
MDDRYVRSRQYFRRTPRHCHQRSTLDPVARLRDHFDDGQTAIASGVRRVDALEILARNGLVMTFKAFVRTLARIRRDAQQCPLAPDRGRHPVGWRTKPSHRQSA